MQKLITYIIISLSLVLAQSPQLVAQGTSPVEVNFIIVNFNQAPTILSVNAAPLKYNKDFALSMQIDDANISLFTHGYPVFEGGVANGTTYPGFSYSDGCGNSHNFKMSASVYVFNGNSENGPDIHVDNSSGQLSWEQMDTIYNHQWGILNHGVNSNANTNPLFIDYSISRNKSYIRRQLYNTTEGGVTTDIFVNPNGSSNWTIPAFNLGNIGALNQNTPSPIGDNGGNVNNPAVDWTQPQNLYRKIAESTNVTSLADDLANSSINGANYWCPIFTHTLTNDYSFSSFTSDFNYIANTYGINGLDNILMTTDEEIQDYLIVRDATVVNYVINGTSMLITYSGEVPDNLLYYSSSIVINSDATISNIIIDGTNDYTYTGVGNTNALINVNWDGKYVLPPENFADSMVTIAATTQTQYNSWIAMDYVITLTNGNHKDSLREVLCNIPNMTYDDGFCNCEINIQPSDTTINFGDCIDLQGAIGDYTYEWFIGDSLVGITQDFYTCPIDTTKYNHIATNPYGCPSKDSILVNINFLSFDLGSDTTICEGNCVTITGPPDMFEYNWFVADTLFDTVQIISPCPIDTTQYTLWVQDTLGGTAIDSISINVLPTPVIDIQPSDTTINYGTCIDLFGAVGDYTYEWFVGDSLVDITQDIYTCPIDTTQYNHIATNVFGCAAEDSIMVNIKFLSFNLGDDTTICEGNCVTITGPPDMFEYNWFVADTLFDTVQIITPCPIDTTQYTLWVEDTLGGTAIDSISINVLPTPVIDIQPSDTTINYAACIELYGAVGDYTYEWFVGDSLVDITQDIYTCPIDTTQYNHIATNVFGCAAEDSIMVNIKFLSFDLGPNQTICENSCITIDGPPNMIEYSWFIADTLFDTVQIINPCPIDTTQYTLWVLNEYGETASDSITISIKPVPMVDFEDDSLYVNLGNDILLTVNSSTGGGNTFSWTYDGNTEFTFADNFYNLIHPIFSDYVYVNLQAENECTANDSTYLTVLEYPEIIVSNDTSVCSQQPITLSVSGGDLFLWIVNTDTLSTDSTIIVFPEVSTNYIAQTAYANSSNYSIDTIKVTIFNSTNTIILFDTNTVCTYAQIQLTASGAENYLWIPDEDTSSIYTFNIIDTTTIWLVGMNDDGCQSIDSATFYNKPAPDVNFTGLDPVYCENDSWVTLTGTPSGGIFQGEGIVDDRFYPQNSEIGTQEIIYTYVNPENCIGYDTNTTIVYGNGGFIDLGPNFTIDYDSSESLNAGIGFDSYFWTTGATTQTIIVHGNEKSPGIYEYAVMGVINGCSTRGSVVITFENTDDYIDNNANEFTIFPNPNNGSFSIKYLGSEKDILLKIFDIQGQLLYEFNNISCNENCVQDIHLNNAKSGIYFLHIITSKGTSTNKMIIKNDF